MPGTPRWALHPLFGAGEDRNQVLDGIDGTPVVLHPLFGAGEDRNAAEMETLLSAG